MRVRELVKYLEVEKLAPFHFYTELSNKEYATCKHITNEELDDYNKKIWTREKIYDNSELGIYLADITINELYELIKECNPVAVDEAINDISYIFLVKLDEYSLIYAIYVILHEVGHWWDFKASGKTSLEYTLWDSEFRREPHKFAKEIYQMPDDSFEKWQLAKIQVDMYKEIPSEKAADTYAHENIKEKLELVRTYIDRFN